MGEVVIVVDGDDLGAVSLAAAFRRHRWSVRLLDLRFGRPTLDAGADRPLVRLDGRCIEPDIVINRTTVSGLGLASAAALDRQLPTSWSGRHLAAREENGLLLACLDVWDCTSRLYNPVRTTDRRLMRPAVESQLIAQGVALGRADSATGVQTVCWVVDGAITASASRLHGQHWRTNEPTDVPENLVQRTAELTGLRLGEVDLWQPDAGPHVLTGWRPVPPFRTIFQQSGLDVAALVVAALLDEAPAIANAFLAEDLQPNLRKPPIDRT